MSLIASLIGINRRSNEVDPFDVPHFWRDILDKLNKSISGKPVTYDTALSSAGVYACVRIIAETLATLPINPYLPKSDGGKKILVDDPLYWLLKYEPNPEQTAVEFWEMQSAYGALRGNAFTQIIRDDKGRPKELWPIPPDYVTIERTARGELKYLVHDGFGYRGTLFKDDMMHFRLLSKDGVWGMSPLQLHRETIGLDLAQQDFASRIMSNSARPSGILEVPGKLGDKERNDAREEWKRQTAGLQNVGSTPILPEGVKWQPLAMKNDELEFIAGRNFSLRDIARIFRMSGAMINDHEHSTFSNIEHLALDFIVNTMRPWFVRWEQCIMRSLLLENQKRRGMYVKFNEAALLRGSMTEQANYFARLIGIGVYTINEVRDKLDLDPVEGGDINRTQMQNVDITKLDEILAAKNAKSTDKNKDINAENEDQQDDSEAQKDGKKPKKEGKNRRIGAEFAHESAQNAFRKLLFDEYMAIFRKEQLALSKNAKKLRAKEFEEWLKDFREEQRQALHDRLEGKMLLAAEALRGAEFTAVIGDLMERIKRTTATYADTIEVTVREVQDTVRESSDTKSLSWTAFVESLASDDLAAQRRKRAEEAARADVEAILTLEGERENAA